MVRRPARPRTSIGQPAPLVRGKEFHQELQADFEATSEGAVTRERACRDVGGRVTGRADIHVAVDGTMDAVVEFKRSDWDAMQPHRVQPNVRRYVRQVWRYVNALLEEGKDVCPGIVFAHTPRDPERKRQVERAFEDECITIVWADDQPHAGA